MLIINNAQAKCHFHVYYMQICLDIAGPVTNGDELSMFDDDDDEIVPPDFPALTSLAFLAGPVPSGILLLYWKYLNSAVSLLSFQEQLFQIGPVYVISTS